MIYAKKEYIYSVFSLDSYNASMHSQSKRILDEEEVMSISDKPRIAMVMGDPAGIGPELISKLLANHEVTGSSDIILIGDRSEFDRGQEIAKVDVPVEEIGSLEDIQFNSSRPLFFEERAGVAGEFVRNEASVQGGQYALGTLAKALDLAKNNIVDAVLFAPLNKTSLHLAGMKFSDELHWFADYLHYDGPFCEFNALDNLWTARVTSHVALKEVPSLITKDRIIEFIHLINHAMILNGIAKPRIGVCGLNPHNGDNGSFGREEIDIITPAVEEAISQGVDARGPYPSDTIFLKVQGDNHAFDAVLTMYHDQGQIAIKLMGFNRGVTIHGGLPIPITTPAHGTAFDIAGSGTANVGATRQAFEIAKRMGLRNRRAREASNKL